MTRLKSSVRRFPKRATRGEELSARRIRSVALSWAKDLLSQPTATFQESGPASVVRAFAKAHRSVRLDQDAAGNLALRLGTPSRKPPLVFMAHLDHPGFVVEGVQGDAVDLRFLGGVRLDHVHRGQPVVFYNEGNRRPVGRGVLVEASAGESTPRGVMLTRGRAKVTRGRAPVGGFTMWDFPGWSLQRGTIASRCLDDLLGAAAALSALTLLASNRATSGGPVIGLFTRAEEVGFYGAIEAIRLRTVPKNSRVISLETSRASAYAPQGGGVIVRVGDARSLFDPQFMGVLHQVAKETSANDPTFHFQRKLMDGGSCEATPYCAAGFRAGGLALPLGNYHNMSGLDGGKRTLGPETVALEDYLSMVKLLVALGRRAASLPQLESATGAWMKPLAQEAKKALRRHPARNAARVKPGVRRASSRTSGDRS